MSVLYISTYHLNFSRGDVTCIANKLSQIIRARELELSSQNLRKISLALAAGQCFTV